MFIGFTIHEAIGLRIRAERDRLGMSTTDLAARLVDLTGDESWTRVKVSRYETAERKIQIDGLVMLAQALGVSVDHLLMPVGKTTVSVAGIPVDMQTVLSRSTSAVDRASDDVDAALKHLADTYEEQKRLLSNIRRAMKGGTQ